MFDMARDIHEHMTVIDDDGMLVGTVECVAEAGVMLARETAPDGRYRLIPPSIVEGVERDQLRLSRKVEQIFARR